MSTPALCNRFRRSCGYYRLSPDVLSNIIPSNEDRAVEEDELVSEEKEEV